MTKSLRQPFIRIVAQIYDDPDLDLLTDAEFRLYIKALAWSKAKRTDGHVPQRVATRLETTDGAAVGLVERQYFRPNGSEGYAIKNWEKYQQTVAEEEEVRRDKMRAGKASARAKKKASGARSEASTDVTTSAPTPVGTPVGTPEPTPVGTPVDKTLDVRLQTLDIRRKTSDDASPKGDPLARGEVAQVWQAYMSTNPGRYSLTEPKRKIIRSGIKTYGLETVMNAVRGWVNDPWEERPQHNGIDVLLRSGNAERMAQFYLEGPPARNHPVDRRVQQLLTESLEEETE